MSRPRCFTSGCPAEVSDGNRCQTLTGFRQDWGFFAEAAVQSQLLNSAIVTLLSTAGPWWVCVCVCVCVCVVPVGIELCGCQGWRSFTERDSFVSCAFGGGCQKIRTNEHCFPPLRRLCLHPCPFVGLCVCWSVGWLHVWLVCQKDYAKKYCNIVSLDVFRHFCLPDFLKQICI